MSARAIGYRRVSTTEQADSGLGLDAQQAALVACAARLGLAVAETFTDAGLSGALGLADRPGLVAAISTLRRGDVLLVAKRDRLAREVLISAQIELAVTKKKARVVSAAGEGTDTQDPSGVLMRTMVDAFASYERAVIALRVRAALDVKRQRGERISGRAPYGYAFDGARLVADDGEQRVLSELRDLRAGGATLRQVAETLNARGHRMRSGEPWCYQRVFALTKDDARRRTAAA